MQQDTVLIRRTIFNTLIRDSLWRATILRWICRLSLTKRRNEEEDLFCRADTAKIKALYLITDRPTVITVRGTTAYKTCQKIPIMAIGLQ